MGPSRVSEKVANEAINWFVRLRADDVTLEDLKAFSYWVRSDYEHPVAFAEVVELWEGLADENRDRPAAISPERAIGKR